MAYFVEVVGSPGGVLLLGVLAGCFGTAEGGLFKGLVYGGGKVAVVVGGIGGYAVFLFVGTGEVASCFVIVNVVSVKEGAVHAGEADFAVHGYAAGTAHASAVDLHAVE